MKRLIVGVDPGLTCGLAALTLDGVPLFVDSRRNWSLSNIIETVAALGEPTIIASDVSPAPQLLEKVSGKFNALLFTPSVSMGSDEKQQLARAYVESYNLKLKNIHEVDALAAAVKAYQHYRNKFEQVEMKVKKAGLGISVDDVKELVVRGYSMKNAIQILLSSEEVKIPPIVRRTPPQEERMKSLVEELYERLALEKEKETGQKTPNARKRKEMG